MVAHSHTAPVAQPAFFNMISLIGDRNLVKIFAVLNLDIITTDCVSIDAKYTANVYRQTTDKLMLKSVISTIR